MNNRKSLATALSAVACASLLSVAAADASTILSFSQEGTGTDFTAVRSGSTTTLAATDLLVDIGGFFAGGTPINGVFFDFLATSVGPAANSTGLAQDFSGTFSFNSLADNTGINYLSGSFVTNGDVNDLTGTDGGSAASFRETTLGLDTLNFASDLGGFSSPFGISLSFVSVSPALALGGSPVSFDTYNASVSGILEAGGSTTVPEPASLMLLGSGLIGLAVRYRSRQRRS